MAVACLPPHHNPHTAFLALTLGPSTAVHRTLPPQECIRIPVDAGIAGSVFQTRATLNVPDAYAHPKFNQDTDKATGYKTQSVLAMPVMTAAGDVIGVIQMVNKQDATNKTVVPFTASEHHAPSTMLCCCPTMPC